jgi:hypothetical protein
MLAPVMFVPLALMVSLVLAQDDILRSPIATTIGAMSGVKQRKQESYLKYAI